MLDTYVPLPTLHYLYIAQQAASNYETDLIFPIITRCCELLKLPWADATPQQQQALKMIGDHVRAIAYLAADGVVPASVGRG